MDGFHRNRDRNGQKWKLNFLRNIHLLPSVVKMTFLLTDFSRSFSFFLSFFRQDEGAIKRLFTRNQRQNRLFV